MTELRGRTGRRYRYADETSPLRRRARRGGAAPLLFPSADPDVVPTLEGIAPLPAQPTELVGREDDLAAAGELLARPAVRLLTLIGPGGAGKTRLALALAAHSMPSFRQGALFVDLAPLSDADLLLSAIARALRLRESPSALSDGGADPLLERLQRHLRRANLLLVLDNFEQVVAGAPRLAELLTACPDVKIVATSRQALRLRWEHVYAVDPLPAPDPERASSLDEIAATPAVQLFVERARAANARFALTEANAADVAALCRRLDGLPLAIELAAARANVLSPSAMLERLTQQARALDFLSAGPTDQPQRQRTIRDLIDWSHTSLPEPERALLRRLSVFRGGATFEAAQAVCSVENEPIGDLLPLVTSLAERSLVRLQQEDDQPRITMLETIREYAWEQLAASGEVPTLQERHLAYMAALAERAEEALRGPEQTLWLERLEREVDNVRAALDAALLLGRVEPGLRVAGHLWRFWEVHGRLREGRRRLEELLAAATACTTDDATVGLDRARAEALHAAAHLAFLQADYQAARALHAADLDLRRALDDRPGQAEALNGLGLVATCLSEFAEARVLFDQAVVISRELGDVGAEAMQLNNLGRVAFFEGDLASARSRHEQSRALRRSIGDDFGFALATADLADVLTEQGAGAAATALLDEAAATWRAQGNRWGLAYVLESLSAVHAAANEPTRATRLLACATAARDALAEPASPTRAAWLQRVLRLARPHLTPAEQTRLWTEGAALPLETALAEGFAPPELPVPASAEPTSRESLAASRPAASDSPLSAREHEVAVLVGRGLTNRQLADELVISERTADAHVAKILKKLRFSSRSQVAAWVAQRGLI